MHNGHVQNKLSVLVLLKMLFYIGAAGAVWGELMLADLTSSRLARGWYRREGVKSGRVEYYSLA